MKYEIHNDRILMRNESGKAIAKILYPEIGKGVCEIAHIYGENTPEGRENASLLMEMAVAEIRQSRRRVVPACRFAVNWFKNHPEEQDIVTTHQAVDQAAAAGDGAGAGSRQEPAGADSRPGSSAEGGQTVDQPGQPAEGGQTVDQAEPAAVAADDSRAIDPAYRKEEEMRASADGEAGSRAAGTASGETDRKAGRRERQRQRDRVWQEEEERVRREDGDPRDRLSKREQRKQEKAARKAEKKARDQEADALTEEELLAERRMRRDEAIEAEEKAIRDEERLDSSLSVVLRLLQVISMICMAVIVVLFIMSAVQQQILQFDTLPHLICLGISAFFVIFCIIQMIWIMTRKKSKDPFVHPDRDKIDKGRGIFGFILVLIISFLCGMVINYVPEEIGKLFGVSDFAYMYQVHVIPIVYAAIAGLVLCIIRKAAGRRM